MSGGEGECAEFVESLADAARQLGVTASTVSRASQRGGEVGLSPREGIVNIVKDVFLADPRGNHIAQISKDGRAGVRMVPQGGGSGPLSMTNAIRCERSPRAFSTTA